MIHAALLPLSVRIAAWHPPCYGMGCVRPGRRVPFVWLRAIVKRNELKRRVRGLGVVFLACLAPVLMGANGCQAFRDSFITSLESATGAALDAALTSLFDQFRSNN